MKSKWILKRMGDICKINQQTYSLAENRSFVNYLDTGNITENCICEIQRFNVEQDTLPSRARRKVAIDDIIYSTVRPNQRHYGIVKEVLPNMLVSTGFAVITTDKSVADSNFIYYYLTQNNIVDSLHAIGEQSVSAYPSIKPSDIEGLELLLPPLSEQIEIGRTLRALDDKIANNTAINHHLEQMAQAIFKSWFVDFEPWGGVMPEDWNEHQLGDFFPVLTGKMNANVSADTGLYPFFSCSQTIAWTNKYSFEGKAILVAGNGDFNVKWYDGKFEAYQRTYVLMPYDGRLLAFLYYVTQEGLQRITSAARGSVINFITKGNIENYSFHAPGNLVDLPIVATLQDINTKIAHNTGESACLATLRNALLPRLMSGELSIAGLGNDNNDLSKEDKNA